MGRYSAFASAPPGGGRYAAFAAPPPDPLRETEEERRAAKRRELERIRREGDILREGESAEPGALGSLGRAADRFATSAYEGFTGALDIGSPLAAVARAGRGLGTLAGGGGLAGAREEVGAYHIPGRTEATEAYERAKDRFAEVPLLGPVSSAAASTGLDIAGQTISDPTVAVPAIAGARVLGKVQAGLPPPTAALPIAERRVNPALRLAVDTELPKLKGLPDDQLRQLMDSSPSEAVERAIEREVFNRAAGTFNGAPGAVAAGIKLPPGSPRAVGPTIQTPEFQTNLFAQVGSPEVRDYIVQRSDEIAAAVGGPQTWDELEEMALRLGTTKDEFLRRNPRFAQMAPEERVRLTMVVKGNEEDIAGLQAKLASGEATDADKANVLRLIEQRGSLIKLAVGVGSEYGRALNSLKMEARAALGEAPLARQALYRRYAGEIDKQKPLLDALANLDPTNPDELQAFIRQVDKPKFREYLQEYWIGSILSGPPTHERNLIGNTVNAVMENAVVRPVRAALDPVIAAAQDREREHFLRETPAAVVGLTQGIRKGLARGFEVLRRGYDVEGPAKLVPIRSAFGRSQNKIVREYVGPVATGSLRLLSAADAVFKTMNYTAEIYAGAANRAAKEGLSGGAFADRVATLVSTPDEAMIRAADGFALKATFNDEASDFGKAFIRLRETVPVVGGFIAPFVKIADRLMVRGLEYTPIGAIKAMRAPKGSVAVSDLTARSAIGTGVMLGAATLALDGRLTASAPADEAERAAFYAAGKQPWSVKLGDRWVPFGQLQPIGTPIALVAAAHAGWAENGEAPNEEKLMAAAGEIGKYVTDQSYMDGLAKFFDAVSGGIGFQKAGTDLATQTAGGMMPLSGLSRSIAKTMDPRVVETPTIKDRLLSQVPGRSRDMQAKLTPWGEEIIPAGGKLRGVLATGTPLITSQEKADPLDQELARLGMPLGYVSNRVFDPRTMQTEKLNREDSYFYQQTAGRRTREMLTGLFAMPEYAEADAEQQRKVVEHTIGVARQYARMKLFSGRGK